ncbi:MAG TPA: type II toxin-antitoxin system Phd/YefM family antitoxin [Candidatus Heimdallarchaeota archaeon]|nr:type II toxin-antitoxin system Phd/YefM family antitoxin [Candidatus Heimdallarchaeota archaeon]
MTNKKNTLYRHKEPSIISIAEGKKRFSSLVGDALEEKKEFIITKRGKPVAVIIPYDEYKQAKRLDGYKKILDAREAFSKSGVSADEVFKESKRQLEKKT